MKYAIITNNIVENIILADAEFAAQIGAIECPDEVSPGWGYVDGTFAEPAPDRAPVPQSVTMRQARLALDSAGLLDTVDAAVAAGPKSIQIEWEFAATVDRNWPTLSALQSALKLSDDQIDTLFIQAATL